jgi:hypothetical protein
MVTVIKDGKRAQIVALLEKKEEEVRKLRELLQLYDSILGEVGAEVEEANKAPRANKGGYKAVVAPGKKRNMELGKAIVSKWLGLKINELSDVPTVAKAVQPQFPNMGYVILSKRVSGIARSLVKKGKLKVEIEGTGGAPHKYKKVV